MSISLMNGMKIIKHKSLNHGWWYHYRVHLPKVHTLCNNSLSNLKNFLNEVSENCPNEYFITGPRSSKIKRVLDVDVNKIENHEVSQLARFGLENNVFKTAHSNVQMFMLQYDNKTIGVEVPIWMFNNEYSDFISVLDSSEVLTGHIDVLRIDDETIWIWDYKPNADREKYASTQVQFYAMMLSRRTNIPIDRFMCGYFDDKVAYTFKPLSIPKWK